MQLLLTRNWQKAGYTIGRLYIVPQSHGYEPPVLLCNTLEPPMKPTKLHPKGCIPSGRYEITLNIQSPKYSKKKAYDWCVGFLPRLLNVNGFDGILIHAGNYPKDTEGCILVGKNTQKGMLTESQKTLQQLYALLKKDKNNTIEIRD